MQVSDKCNVYSFGVVALEVMMGRHPGDMLESLSVSSKTLSENPELLSAGYVRPTATTSSRGISRDSGVLGDFGLGLHTTQSRCKTQYAFCGIRTISSGATCLD